MKKNEKNWVGELATAIIKVVAQFAGENADVIANSFCGDDEKSKSRGPRKKKIKKEGSDE